MRPVRVDVPGSGSSPSIPLDTSQVGPITVSITGVSGTVDIDVQYTLNDIWDPDVTPEWHDAGAPLNGVSAATGGALVDANVLIPQRIVPVAIRALNNAAGTAVMNVVQSGVMG